MHRGFVTERRRHAAALALALLGGCGSALERAETAAPPPPSAACAPTAAFAFVCGADRPEDLARIPGTRWLIASGFSTGAGLKLIDSQARTARLWFTDVAVQTDRDPALADCATPPDIATFTARGLSLRVVAPGRAELHVVNHGGRETIERFAVDFTDPAAPPRLRWRGCLAMPEGYVANSVATYSDGTVLATVLTRPGMTITDFVRGKATGAVFERRSGEPRFRLLPGTELRGNNGLETARDDSGFYVVAFGSREVVAFDRYDTASPAWRVTAPEFMPDNIHWDGDRLLLAGMVRDEPACGGVRRIVDGVADGMTCHRGYAVAQLDPVARDVRLIAYGEPDPVFNGVSAGVIIGNELWLGSYQANRVAIRLLP